MSVHDRNGLNRYTGLYLWMVIPMAIMQIGIFHDYWGDLTENAWPVHVHYWTATLWYLFLILQPYYAERRQFDRHRTNGIIGFFLAGGVALTALSALNRDIVNAGLSAQMRDQFGPFEPWFFYGVATVELVMMSAFIFAVIQSIRHRRSLQDHAWWLISTVFIIMMPALGRGLQFLWVVLFGKDGPGQVIMPLYLATGIIVVLLIWAALRYGRLNHPATWLALGANLFNLLIEPLGKWEWLQSVLRATIKG
ncbi:hypothetical protein OF829_20135 [Sphingomonas sp. LB-2]|uniref:hypothetical protein n=1 Tax=Sphingomonas caeni TaxID=2984949 RepID=UPI00223138CE|nr:hypothetical protein [Sphingomonas caeni]MCW3849553.1 hypothetical protein [Sphingomonas caeni]